jgi:hypothetical protein
VLLFVDHFMVHLSGQFIQAVNDLGINVNFVPAIRYFNDAWCLEQYPKILDQDKLPTPDHGNVYEWTTRSFDLVKQFKKPFFTLVEKDALKDLEVDDKNDQTDQAEEGGSMAADLEGMKRWRRINLWKKT